MGMVMYKYRKVQIKHWTYESTVPMQLSLQKFTLFKVYQTVFSLGNIYLAVNLRFCGLFFGQFIQNVANKNDS